MTNQPVLRRSLGLFTFLLALISSACHPLEPTDFSGHFEALRRRGFTKENRTLYLGVSTSAEALALFFPEHQSVPLDRKSFHTACKQATKDHPFVYRYANLPPYAFSVPVDWDADPLKNREWRFRFQALDGLPQFYEAGNADSMFRTACLISDWVDDQLGAGITADFAFYDHALARRVERVLNFIDDLPNELLVAIDLEAIVLLLTTHAYALAGDRFYPDIPNNHGIQMDIALILLLNRYPVLVQKEAMEERANKRLIAQVKNSVASDGMHVENSPGYILYYISILNQAIRSYQVGEKQAPEAVYSALQDLVQSLPYFTKPDLSLAAFGSTLHGSHQEEIETQRQLLPDSLDTGALDWVLSAGQEGQVPQAQHRVFEKTGYAIFRSDWSGEDVNDVVVGYFRCGRLVDPHYQQDEGSFEIYAHGKHWVSDSGHYAFEKNDPIVAHQYSVFGHSTLVVDDAEYEFKDSRSSIVAYDTAAQIPYAVCSHNNYRKENIDRQYRTFAFVPPETFIVIDEVKPRPGTTHHYTALIQLHPEVDQIDASASSLRFASRSRSSRGQGFWIENLIPTVEIKSPRGIFADERAMGWYFPTRNEKVPATVIELKTRPQRDVYRSGFVIRIAKNEGEKRQLKPTAVRIEIESDKNVVHWTDAKGPQEIHLPLHIR